MSFKHTVTSVDNFIYKDNYNLNNAYDFCLGKLLDVTTGQKNQIGPCQNLVALDMHGGGDDYVSYKVLRIYGWALVYESKDTTHAITVEQSGYTNRLYLNLYGGEHFSKIHLRTIEYSPGYNRLDIHDYTGENTSVGEMKLYILRGFQFRSYYGNLDGKTGNWEGIPYKRDPNSMAFRDYVIKSYKYYYKKDIDLPYLGDDMLASYNVSFAKMYLTPIPVVSNNSDYKGFINNNKPWDKYTPEYPPIMSTNWKVYLDGTKMPNIKVVWHNEEIENKKKIENTRINVSFAEVDPELPDTLRVNDFIKTTDVLPYDDGNYKISFKDFYSKCGNGEYDEGISSILPKKSGWLILSIDYYANVTEVLPTASSQKMCARILPSGELVGYYGVWTDKTDKSTIKVIINGVDAETGEEVGDGSEDDGYTDEKDSEENDLQDGQNNSLGVLTSTYNMTRERLNQLGSFLWGANVFDEFSLINSNPIENIVSCKNIPFSIGGTDEVIKLGNVDTGVNGAKITNNFGEMTIGSITVPKKYNSFLDFAPYTKLTIYLPYIGFKELDVTLLMGKTITIKYVVDVITGGCLAEIYVSSTRMYEFSGQVGVDIPITASNRAQVEGAYISNAVGMGASLASGNIQGVASSLVSGAMSKYSYSSTDKPNANCVASANRTCFVIIDRPTYQNLKSFNHTKGRMCNLSKKIGNLKGFTICDKNIDLSDIVATEAEKEELTNILSSGFFA